MSPAAALALAATLAALVLVDAAQPSVVTKVREELGLGPPQAPGATPVGGSPGPLPSKANTPIDVPAHAAFPEEPIGRVITRRWYGHGGFMGEAPRMISNKKWAVIVRVLAPQVYKTIVNSAKVGDIIKACENSPIGAAYAFLHGRGANLPYEWDMFFPSNQGDISKLVGTALVAHGGALDLLGESLANFNTYESVKKTKVTELGGVQLTRWRDLFVRAVRLARAPAVTIESLKAVSRQPVEWRDFASLFPGGKFRVVLDIKSGMETATPAFLCKVHNQLKQWGVEVLGVGTFNPAQIDNTEAMCGLNGVLFFHAPYGAWGTKLVVKGLLDTDKKFLNRDVAFNAGFLIKYSAVGGLVLNNALAVNNILKSYQVIPETLAELKKRATDPTLPKIRIGVYVQEYDIDSRALAVISKVVDENPDIFKLGFAWGGMDKDWYASVRPTRTKKTLGLAGQAILGKTTWSGV